MASDAPDANATQGSNEKETLHQGTEMAHQNEAELETNNLLNVGVLRVMSGNITKRLGTRQETWGTTQAKTAATTI